MVRLAVGYIGNSCFRLTVDALKPKVRVRVMVGLDTSIMALYNTDENHQSTSEGIKLTNKL